MHFFGSFQYLIEICCFALVTPDSSSCRKAVKVYQKVSTLLPEKYVDFTGHKVDKRKVDKQMVFSVFVSTEQKEFSSVIVMNE